jgi:hypothetical protein
MAAVHADHEIAACLGKLKWEMCRCGGRRRARQKHAREVPNLRGRCKQPVGRVVDALLRWIGSRHEDGVVPAVPDRVIGFCERRIGARLRRGVMCAQLGSDVVPRRVLRSFIEVLLNDAV